MLQSIIEKSRTLLGVGKTSDSSCNNNINNNVNIKLRTSESIEYDIRKDDDELKDMIYDFIRNIRDPEKPSSLEELNVVDEDCIEITPTCEDVRVIRIEFNPTVPHCSLATLIGLCIRIKLERNLTEKFKLDIFIRKGAHSTEDEINKQINDKERIAAAMENPNLRDLVEKCLLEED